MKNSRSIRSVHKLSCQHDFFLILQEINSMGQSVLSITLGVGGKSKVNRQPVTSQMLLND